MKTKKFMTTALATFMAVSILAIGTYLSQTSFVSSESSAQPVSTSTSVSATTARSTTASTTASTTVSTTTSKMTTRTESHIYGWKEVYGKRYLKIDKKILQVGQMSKGRNISLGLMEQQQQDF